jgi:hypothetical protein
MGHASLLTTGAYDRRPELARLAAVERLHFRIRPYKSSLGNARSPVGKREQVTAVLGLFHSRLQARYGSFLQHTGAAGQIN